MRIESRTVSISKTLIDSYLWSVLSYLRGKCGVDGADRALSPLQWYVVTGRASTDFLGRLVQVKPYVIGRILLKGGSDLEVIEAVKKRVYREVRG